MSPILKEKIYRYIDQNGFGGHHSRNGGMLLSFDIEAQTIERVENSSPSFTPDLPFELSEKEQCEVIGDYIFDLSGIRVDLNNIDKHSNIEGKPFVLPINEHGESAYCLAFKLIPGSLFIRGRYGIKSLGRIEQINGDLGFSECELESLGQLKVVKGSVWTAQSGVHYTKLKTLSPLFEVGGDCNLKMTPIETLGTLKRVEGNLNLRNTFVEDIGDLEYVGGNVLLSKHLDLDFSKVDVKGKFRIYSD
jgi:hypothetical protein